MSTSRQVSFFSSITTKVTLALIFSFVAIITLVFYVVDKEGYEKVRVETDKVAIETGRLAISAISNDIKNVAFNTDRLRDNAEILPLDPKLFDLSILKIFNTESTPINSASILPDLERSDNSMPAMQKISYSGLLGRVTTTQKAEYKSIGWSKVLYSASPENCLWNHLQYDKNSQELLMDCSMPIFRNNSYWGMVNASLDVKNINSILSELNEELEQTYAILLDNSNQIIATSNKDNLPVINYKTGKPFLLNEYIENNPAWSIIASEVTEHRQAILNEIRPNLTRGVIRELNGIDQAQQATNESMLLNYAANQKKTLSSLFDGGYVGKYLLKDDPYLRNDSLAYVFTVPETNWQLVIVQSEKQGNAVAENLSKNIIKYLMFSLLFVLALIFFMLDFLSLQPLQETSQTIKTAETLIDTNQYHRLSEVAFPKIKSDEMGVVNSSLKSLLQRIQDNEGKLANINEELEIKVEERTSELKNAMTELKSSQLQLIRSEKMATLGQMVAGVAHEVNTPLTYVQNNVEIIGQLTEQYEELVAMVNQLKQAMLDESTPEEEIEELMGEMIGLSEELEEDEISDELKDLIKDSLFGVEQIAEMVLNLRNFSRLDESKVKKTDLRECVNTSLKIAQNAIKHYQVNTDLQDIPTIECSPSQVNQVVINLLNNAAQAIDDTSDGQIDISTTSDEVNVYINIKDNGSGMSPEVQAKIFEPFFTTKGAGEGTGLGMAISHQIMEQHNGRIALDSTEGVGTEFSLIFPIHKTISIEDNG